MENIRVGIYGLGLIGGSIALGVKSNFPGSKVIGFGRDLAKLESAKRLGIIDACSPDNPDDIASCDYFIIATPSELVGQTFARYMNSLSETCIVMDAASVKRQVLADVAKVNKRGLRFIGAHPLAGSEKSGVEFARSDLFEKKIVAITAEGNEDVLGQVRDFWKGLGAQIVLVSADFHDEIVASTSHVPHLVSAAISRFLEKDGWAEVRFFGLYGKGLLDTTRISQGPAEMWTDITLLNADNVERSLISLSREIDSLIHLVRNQKRQELVEYLQKAREFRENL
jgi:prephenate dehydrogenase